MPPILDEEISQLVRDSNLPGTLLRDVHYTRSLVQSAIGASRNCDMADAVHAAQLAGYQAGTIAGLLNPILEGTEKVRESSRTIAFQLWYEMRNYMDMFYDLSEQVANSCTCARKDSRR